MPARIFPRWVHVFEPPLTLRATTAPPSGTRVDLYVRVGGVTKELVRGARAVRANDAFEVVHVERFAEDLARAQF